MATSTLAAVRRLVEHGLGVTPLGPGSKIPVLKDWPSRAITKALGGEALEAALTRAFNNGAGIGAVWGAPSSDLVDIDLDHAIAVQLALHLLPATRCYGRKSRPMSHWLYRCPGVKTLKLRITGHAIAGIDGMLVELKAAGQQSAVPPSVHPSGEHYQWSKGTPRPLSIAAADLDRRVRLLGAATVLTGLWSSGSRHDLSLALSGAT
jgi:Bifunctional DNA primase/polymerase, N-terminal